jgi:hypothetical protein
MASSSSHQVLLHSTLIQLEKQTEDISCCCPLATLFLSIDPAASLSSVLTLGRDGYIIWVEYAEYMYGDVFSSQIRDEVMLIT